MTAHHDKQRDKPKPVDPNKLKTFFVAGLAAAIAERLKKQVFDLAAELATDQANSGCNANYAARAMVVAALCAYFPQTDNFERDCVFGVNFNDLLAMVVEQLPRRQMDALHGLDAKAYSNMVSDFCVSMSVA